MARDVDLPHTSSEQLEDSFDRLIALSQYESFSLRELRLLANYINPNSSGYCNGVRSAALAGYTGLTTTLAVQASRTLRKAKACGLMAIILDQHGAGVPQAAAGLADCLRARRTKAFLTKKNEIVQCDLGPDYPVQMQAFKLTFELHGGFEGRIDGKLSSADKRGTRTMENFNPITIDGVLVNPPASAQQVNGPPVASTEELPPVNPHLPPELQELQRGIRNLTVQDQMLLGTALDQMVNIMRLKLKLMKEQEALQAAQNPTAPSEGEKSG